MMYNIFTHHSTSFSNNPGILKRLGSLQVFWNSSMSARILSLRCTSDSSGFMASALSLHSATAAWWADNTSSVKSSACNMHAWMNV